MGVIYVEIVQRQRLIRCHASLSPTAEEEIKVWGRLPAGSAFMAACSPHRHEISWKNALEGVVEIMSRFPHKSEYKPYNEMPGITPTTRALVAPTRELMICFFRSGVHLRA